MGKRHKHDSRPSRSNKSRRHDAPPSPHKLLKYAALGKVRKMRDILADQPDVQQFVSTTTGRDGATALHEAARHGQLEAVQLLLRRDADAAAADAAGNTPGHLAAMHGHWLVLTELIKAADIALDAANNVGLSVRAIVQLQQQQQQQDDHSPGQAGSGAEAAAVALAAAMAGPAHAAASRDPVQGGQPAGGASDARERAVGGGCGGSDEEDSLAWSGDDDGVAAAERAADAAAGAASADAAWREKLAFECGYDDPTSSWGRSWGGAWDHAGPAAAAAAAGGPAASAGSGPARGAKRSRQQQQQQQYDLGSDEEDDTWADRLWQDMQEHQRQMAAAAAAAKAAAAAAGSGGRRAGGFGMGPSREAAAKERQRRAAAAAEESARILREEQAKDSDWRAAMMRQIEEAALPLRRTTYEERWQQFEALPPAKAITFNDVPWPCPTPATQATARRQQQQQHLQLQQQVLQLDQGQLRTLVLAGASSPADVKLALRKELMRWHPDKFTARYGARLSEADRDAIQAGVHAVAQHLTALKQ